MPSSSINQKNQWFQSKVFRLRSDCGYIPINVRKLNLTDEYLEKVLTYLENIDRKKKGTIAFSCPYCSNSFKGSKKTKRCSAFVQSPKNRSWFFNCFRCGKTMDFAVYLEDRHPDLFKEYHLKRDQEGSTGRGFNLRKYKGNDIYKPNFQST